MLYCSVMLRNVLDAQIHPNNALSLFLSSSINTHHLVVVALLRSITMIEQKDDHGIG